MSLTSSKWIITNIDKPFRLDIKEVFDLFDFWDGRDGMIDAVKVPDLLRCAGMNPTNKISLKHGATKKAGKPISVHPWRHFRHEM